LGFLRRQHNYFLLDATTHFVNALLYSPKTVSLPLYSLWIFAFVIHMYYYYNLKTNPPPRRNEQGKTKEDDSHKISRIFHWSCVEYQPNRFNILHSGKEMSETAIDIIAHTAGFILAFRMLESYWYQLGALILMFAVFYRQMLALKYFLTEPKMMPPQLQRLFTAFFTNSVTN